MSDWNADEHPRDERGRFTTKAYKQPNIVEYRKFNGIEVSSSEYAVISESLNKKYAGMNIVKGTSTYAYTANYRYIVRVNDYNDYTPIMRWRIK